MKFGKYLRNNMISRYEEIYIDYKGLKKLLMDLGAIEEERKSKQTKQPHGNNNNNNNNNNKNYILQFQASQQVSDRNSKFLLSVWNQFQKVDRFIQDNEKDLSSKSNYMESSKDAQLIISCIKEIEELQNFVQLNLDGFRKILKKFDKKFTITIGHEYFKNMIYSHFQAKISVLNYYNTKLSNIYSLFFGDPEELKNSERSESGVFSFCMDEQE
ncbi:hypothetical protein DDB_G0269734 [Dictyostelium discoideum AX4]|uniref:SPX domain-containing protein n=1 Tax=Dictyostelium discoideum TaxID=44689 RepID=Q55D96_DICDI|nr:hypothetical protein DDB_G0269734 [Dictyostelium discoideum AX4]EAL72217.1 hypothetical protein DDB_G0269734 [Dictyostelium discoideum AX4]|eukprot:XP_646235.1 hypothetical protein DDB_G0269734 [Dictyostelium discoideum AX4]